MDDKTDLKDLFIYLFCRWKNRTDILGYTWATTIPFSIVIKLLEGSLFLQLIFKLNSFNTVGVKLTQRQTLMRPELVCLSQVLTVVVQSCGNFPQERPNGKFIQKVHPEGKWDWNITQAQQVHTITHKQNTLSFVQDLQERLTQ